VVVAFQVPFKLMAPGAKDIVHQQCPNPNQLIITIHQQEHPSYQIIRIFSGMDKAS
jgi:hypothetical protein